MGARERPPVPGIIANMLEKIIDGETVLISEPEEGLSC
jgi:hypothetical protein